MRVLGVDPGSAVCGYGVVEGRAGNPRFVAINVQSAFRLGEARAMAMLAAAERDLEIFEYPPNEVKLCVAGHGHADKAQVKYMVRKMLRLDAAIELADDASDALAIALCHLGRGRLPNLVEAIERVAGRKSS